jgi:hypothetical protein
MTSRFLTLWSDVDFGAVSHYFLSSSHQSELAAVATVLLACGACHHGPERGRGTKRVGMQEEEGAGSQPAAHTCAWLASLPHGLPRDTTVTTGL